MSLKSKVAIVTGGNSGIGQAIVLELAREGASIVIDYLFHPEATEALEQQITKLGDQSIGVNADVSKLADLQKLVDAAVTRFGRLDIMVNNAGIETRTSVLDTSENQYDKVMAINLKSAFFGTQIAAKQMIKQAGGGRIINITSVHEDWPMPGNTAYCLAKGGMRMLAPSGKSILLLERGDWLKREAMNWDTAAVFEQNRYVSPDTWYDRSGRPFQPQVHYFVGGATKIFGAALYRLRQKDFGELRHHDGISPAWPITYEQLEPYYTRAEQMYHVHGLRGRDPSEPPASGPYPCDPVSNEPRIQRLFDDLTAAGYHPFPAPSAVMMNERNMAYSTCIRCQTCDGFPCLVHAKSDAEIVAVRPALEFPNVTLLRNAKALKLETNADGTAVTEVVAEVGGEREAFRGDIVVVSCGAANTAKLLLMSANDEHPNGLANGSDQVGRNYMFHNSQAVLAISREPNPTMFQKTLALNDFYFGMDGFEYPMGNIQMIGKSLGQMYKGEKPIETALLPTGLLGDLAHHAVDFWLSTEDLPDPENRVTVNRSGKLTLSYTPNNQVPKQKLYDKLKSMLHHLGMYPDHLIPRNIYMKTDIPIAGCAHQAGTCRFGKDAKTSVLDTNCKAHELDNLYVVDTSFFVSIGAVNPSLTAIANAIRVGDHLLRRLG